MPATGPNSFSASGLASSLCSSQWPEKLFSNINQLMSLLCLKPCCLSHFTQGKAKALTVTHKALHISSHLLSLFWLQLHWPPHSYGNTHQVCRNLRTFECTVSPAWIHRAYSLPSLKSPFKCQLFGEAFTEHPLSPGPSACLPFFIFLHSIV